MGRGWLVGSLRRPGEGFSWVGGAQNAFAGIVMDRSLDHLGLQAALRRQEPATDPIVSALSTPAGAAALETLSPTLRAWWTVRDRWFDRVLRRLIMPGHARVMWLGAGLDPSPLRWPPGLLGEGSLWLVDRPDVLDARAERLAAAGLSDPACARFVQDDPIGSDRWLSVLHEQAPNDGVPLLVLVTGLAPFWSMDRLQHVAQGLMALPHQRLFVGFDWFGPGLRGLDAPMVQALGAAGAPFGLDRLGLEMIWRALGADRIDTEAILSHGAREVGMVTLVQRIGAPR